jgi:hypothetical protein
MAKVRVHELAKELDANSKEIIGLMSGFGFPTRNHMSSLEQEELDVLFERLTQAYDKKVEIPVFGKVKQEEPKPAKKKAKKEENHTEEAAVETEEMSKVDEPIGRKVRHVDTRQTVVDLNKIDDEVIEELIPENVNSEGVKKQKIKNNKKNLNLFHYALPPLFEQVSMPHEPARGHPSQEKDVFSGALPFVITYTRAIRRP